MRLTDCLPIGTDVSLIFPDVLTILSLLLTRQRFCADVVSVLAMTMSGERECLKYRLLGSQEELASWGHEYVRYTCVTCRTPGATLHAFMHYFSFGILIASHMTFTFLVPFSQIKIQSFLVPV